MSFRINRAEFLKTLRCVEPGLSTRDFIQQSSSFVFDSGWCATYNAELCCRIKSGLPDDITGAVRAKPLLAALDNITDDDVAVAVSGEEFRLTANRKRVGVRMEAEILLPTDQVDLPSAWTDLHEDFGKAVEHAAAAAGTNTEEFKTVCVHVHPDWLEASDRNQVARYMLPTGVDRSCLVRAVSLAHVPRYGFTRMGVTDNWLHFRNKFMVFSVIRHLEDFPDLTPFVESRGTPTILPRGGVEGSKIGAIFSEGDAVTNKVAVSLTPGRMLVRGEGAYGWGEADLETTYKGPPLNFRISPTLLERIITQHTECEVSPGRLIVRDRDWVYFSVLAPDGPPVVEEAA